MDSRQCHVRAAFGGGGGGSNSVAQEAMGLARLGVDVRLAVNAPNYSKFLASYPELEALKIPVLSYADGAGLAQHFASCQIAVATTNAFGLRCRKCAVPR